VARVDGARVDSTLPLPRELDQVRALYEMRWRMFKRNMRRDEEKLSFVMWLTGRILVFGFSIGSGAVFALVMYVAMSEMDRRISPIFNVVFLGWQGLSLLRGTLPHGVEVELLRFPLRFRTYVALWLSAGLFEGLTILGTWLCLGMYVGLVLGGANPWTSAVVMLLFFACNLFVSRATFLWFSRMLAKRKIRDFMLVLFSAIGILPQLLRSRGAQISALFARLPIPPWFFHAMRQTPGYLAGRAVTGDGRAAVWLTAWDAAFCGMLLMGLHRAFLGDDIHEFAASETKPMSARKVRAGGGATAGSPVMAIVGIEWAKLRHGGAAIYSLVAPLLYVVLFGLRMARGPIGVWMVPAAAAYVGLGFRSFNTLGSEGAGVQTYLLLPVPLRTILIGKNVFAAMVYAAQVVASTAILTIATRRLSLTALLFTLVWMVGYMCVCMMLGNDRSLRAPVYVATDKLTVRDARKARRAGGWMSLLAVLGTSALGAGLVAFCTRQHHPGWAVWMMLPFSAVAAWYYMRSLNNPQYMGDIAATEALLTRVAKAA